jgi:hypothetical protein
VRQQTDRRIKDEDRGISHPRSGTGKSLCTLDEQLEKHRLSLETEAERRAAELRAEHEKRLQSLEEKERLLVKRSWKRPTTRTRAGNSVTIRSQL